MRVVQVSQAERSGHLFESEQAQALALLGRATGATGRNHRVSLPSEQLVLFESKGSTGRAVSSSGAQLSGRETAASKPEVFSFVWLQSSI